MLFFKAQRILLNRVFSPKFFTQIDLGVFFFAAMLPFVFYFSFLLARDSLAYFSLSSTGKASVFQWEVVEIKGKYPIKASYSFNVDGKVWKNTFTFAKPWSWNQASAIELLKERAKQNWTVWYQPKNPAVSVLEKKIPLNLFFRTLVCYIIFIYFLFLRKRFFKLSEP